MTCPNCQSEDTRVTNTYPGLIVTRRHHCKKCGATWRSKQKLEHGSLLIATGQPLVAPKPLLVTTSINEPIILSGSDPGEIRPDLNPTSPGNPERARPRRAKKKPTYEPEFLLIWGFTGKRGTKSKAQAAWVSVGRPAFKAIEPKYREYRASLAEWQGEQHLATWFNGWGHEQEWAPAPPPRVVAKFESIEVRREREREERLMSEQEERLFGRAR